MNSGAREGGRMDGTRRSLARTPPNNHVRLRPPINWVYQTEHIPIPKLQPLPDDPPASNPLPNGVLHDPRYLTLPAISAPYGPDRRA